MHTHALGFRPCLSVLATALSSLCLPALAQTAPAACSTSVVSATLDAAKITTAPHLAIQNTISVLTASRPTASVKVVLNGTFQFTESIYLQRSCVTFVSLNTAQPAKLRWAGTPGLPEKFLIDNSRATASHRVTINGVIFEGLGVLLNGYGHKVTNSQFNQASSPLYFHYTQSSEATNNKFTDGPGFASRQLKNSLIASNQFTRTIQPISVAGQSLGNTFENNTGTGTVMFSIELLGLDAGPTPNTSNVGNIIRGNKFSAPSKPINWDPVRAEFKNHGAYGGISVPVGTDNLITANTLDCTGVCPGIVVAVPEGTTPLFGGVGIEAAGVNTKVMSNTVTAFTEGIMVAESSEGAPANDTTLVYTNVVNKSSQAIVIQCTKGSANGVDATRSLQGCRKTFQIVGNRIFEARSVGIGGSGGYYPSGNAVPRYAVSTASESKALTIGGNMIVRTFGAYAEDRVVNFGEWSYTPRFTAIAVDPILSPTQLLIERNQITFTGSPAPAALADRDRFNFRGISVSLQASDNNGKVCDILPGAQTFAGSRILSNVIKQTGNATAVGIQSACNAVAGLIVTGNTFDALRQAVEDVNGDVSGMAFTSNRCLNGTRCN
jgi:hypothetical protein